MTQPLRKKWWMHHDLLWQYICDLTWLAFYAKKS